MAPGRRPRDVQFPHELGKVGRRTGITLPDSGQRDENGLEPMDHLFSSPEKPAQANVNGRGAAVKNAADTTNSTEADMDVVDSTLPDPVGVFPNQTRASFLPPRSSSPRKTYLQSPARHNPAMGRGSSTDAVVRQPNFTNNRNFNSANGRSAPSPRLVAKTAVKSASSNLKNPLFFPAEEEDEEEDESIDPVGTGAHHEDTDYAHDNVDQVDGVNGMVEEPEVVEKATKPAPKVGKPSKRGQSTKPKVSEPVAAPPAKNAEGVTKKGRGRPPKSKPAAVAEPAEAEDEEVAAPADHDENDEATQQRRKKQKLSVLAEQWKLGKARQNDAAPDLNAPKVSRPKKVKAPQPEAPSPAQVIRQPPRPNARGVLISRRENTNGLIQTRSGRHSFKPIASWRGEKIIYTESDIPNQQAGHYNTVAKQSIAEIIRVDEPEPDQVPRRARGRPKADGARPKKRRADSDDDEDADDAEPWESEPGRIVGDIRLWDPANPTAASAEHVTEEIALSNAAIVTRGIPGCAFRFAKTLTLPFFGSGMVDLPAGGVKKPKNSRKMHMCFLVFYGRVKVTVDQNEFRIGKGGMWQVPRGNFYSIENDYDKPARIFFSQGCEMEKDESVAE